MDLAMEANDKGDYFPIWGTCLGFEVMLMAVAKNSTVLQNFNSTNHSLKLKFYDKGTKSDLYQDMPDRMRTYLQHEKAMFFNHKLGVSNETFLENENLMNFYKPLTYNHDKNGKCFVSSIEAYSYPFYGTQFHPEKLSFELKDSLDIMHNPGSIEAEHYFADFFVNLCK